MKYILILTLVYKASALPIPNDRIFYPDEFNEIKSRSLDDWKAKQLSLLNDSNILISDNTTLDFLIDEHGFENFEDGEYFQGDMMMLDEQLGTINNTSDMSYRTGLLAERFRWPKNAEGKVIVPFTLSDHYGWKDRSSIKLAMYNIEKFSCIEFKERTDQSNYINIISERGCYSYAGKINGGQKLSLRIGGCLSRGTIIHELMHALGFDHMHNHVDRDKFIDIKWENIKPGNEKNFEKVDSRLFGNFGTTYDYYSVMHYKSDAFSKSSGYPTMVPKNPSFKNVIGNRVGLSAGDVKRLNTMYNCTASPNSSVLLNILSSIF